MRCCNPFSVAETKPEEISTFSISHKVTQLITVLYSIQGTGKFHTTWRALLSFPLSNHKIT